MCIDGVGLCKMNNVELPLQSEVSEDFRSGFVAVVGRPNVGKSTLINSYVGQKVAIVSPKPQTTRRRLLGILTVPDAQIVFVDTPGYHEPQHKLGEYMVETALRSIPDADLVLFMVDVSSPPRAEDRKVGRLIGERATCPCILVMNKVDLLSPREEEQRSRTYLDLAKCQESVLLSATEGRNRDQLLDLIIQSLPPGPQYYPQDQITDQPLRFLAGELIREQVLRQLHHEVPHWMAVVVEEFQERGPDLTHIEATVYVAKDSQKGIVIGKGGAMLKGIGQAARKEIENLLGTKVYLELWVKIRKRWLQDEAALRHLGYGLPKEDGPD